MSQLVTVKGTVMEFEWAKPHPMITLGVPAYVALRFEPIIGSTTDGDQQIRGNCSPLNISTIRDVPIAVRSVT